MLMTNLFLAILESSKESKLKCEPISVKWLNDAHSEKEEFDTQDAKLVLIEAPMAAVGRGVHSRLIVTQVSILPSSSLYPPSIYSILRIHFTSLLESYSHGCWHCNCQMER